ncbi:hypothetical protein [Thioclava sp. GXIMD4215]|uniref:hypothetical protein n=1 Tax=Thioclava sp. GXIMD4215 TaxID=3131928 RepID=UPI003249C1CF
MMADYCLTFGLLLIVFAIPAGVSAYSEMRPPRMAAVTIVLGACLVILAVTLSPTGYSYGDIPQAVARVMARFLP